MRRINYLGKAVSRSLMIGAVLSVVSAGLLVPGAVLGQTNTILRVLPSSSLVTPGATFTVAIAVSPATGTNVAGVQLNIAFNPAALTVVGVAEGAFLQSTASAPGTYFQSGTIDNVAGTVVNVVDAIMTPGRSVTTEGTLLVLTCTAKTPGAASNFALSNVIVGNKDGVAVPLGVPVIGQVTVSLPYDVNKDGKVNVSDLVAIGKVLNTTGQLGRAEDVNLDGAVTVLDMILVGQHFS
jgi:hypothetical protein